MAPDKPGKRNDGAADPDASDLDGLIAERDVLLQCLLGGFGSVFPQCGLMVFPGAVIVSR